MSAAASACSLPNHGADAETLMKHADAAMYEAKRAGGGCRVYGGSKARSRRLALRTKARS